MKHQERFDLEVVSELRRADAEFYGAPEYIYLALTDEERRDMLAQMFTAIYDPNLAPHGAEIAASFIRDYADVAFQRYLTEGYSND